MQPTKNRLVATMLAAGANRKKAPVWIFFVKIICATPTVYLFHELFFTFLRRIRHIKKVSCNRLIYLTFERYMKRDNSPRSEGNENNWEALWKKEEKGSLIWGF